MFTMFSLSVVDHLRLNFRLVVQNYSAHARAAERFATAALRTKLALLVLFALATASIGLSLFRPERAFQIAAVVMASVAFTVYVMSIAFGIEARVTFASLARPPFVVDMRAVSGIAH